MARSVLEHASSGLGAPHWRRALATLHVFAATMAVLAIADLAARAALRLEPRWDVWVYHLPFAAVYGHLGIPFDMHDAMRLRLEGFPPLPHLVQGVLWKVTGTVHATGVVNLLAFTGFLAYCQVVLGARFWFVALVALTAPLVIIHSATGYVDLFANSLLATGTVSCLSLVLQPDQRPRAAFAGALIGLGGAAWSKFQLTPIAALLFVVLGLIVSRGPVARRVGPRRDTLRLLAVAILLTSAPYLDNIARFGNPFWPQRVPVIGDVLPYRSDAIDTGRTAERPRHMLGVSQPVLFVHSLLEIGHPTRYASRPRWVIDQGNATVAFRMGGFWGMGAAVFIVALLLALVALHGRAGVAAAAGGCGLLVFVSVLPQSNELRYYMFLPLTWAAGLALAYNRLMARSPGAAGCALLTVLTLFGYMASENRVHYEIEQLDVVHVATQYGVNTLWPNLQPGRPYCVVGTPLPQHLMLTGPTLREFSIASRSSAQLCPPGTTVLP